jgi:hypothetical protein
MNDMLCRLCKFGYNSWTPAASSSLDPTRPDRASGGLFDGVVIESEQIDGILPRDL